MPQEDRYEVFGYKSKYGLCEHWKFITDDFEQFEQAFRMAHQGLKKRHRMGANERDGM